MKIVIILGLAACVGCSAFRPPTQILTVTTVPTNAVLTINGIKYNPPVKMPVKRDKPVIIECEATGFTPQVRTVDSNLNFTAFLDTVGFLFVLFPGLGLASPGSHSLDYTTVQMDLTHPYVAPTPTPPIHPRK